MDVQLRDVMTSDFKNLEVLAENLEVIQHNKLKSKKLPMVKRQTTHCDKWTILVR